MVANNKLVAVGAVALIILSSCLIFFTVNENIPEDTTRYPVDLHDGMSQTFLNTYTGVDYKSLDKVNERYWEGEMTVEGGCTASFANYYGNKVGAVRNMDLYQTENGVYDIIVYPDGDTVKYTTAGICYVGPGDTYTADEVRKNGMSKERYEMIPFLTQDCMSYGGKYADGTTCKCLYTCTLIREAQYNDDFSDIIWRTAGTCPEAAITSTVVSLNAVIAYNCCTVEEALRFTGATLYDETKDPNDYVKIYDDTPGVNIYSMWRGSYNWNIVTTLCDGEGNCGFLEVIDGHVIYVPCNNVSAIPKSLYPQTGFNWEYSVSANFYLDKHYLLNSETSDVSKLSILPDKSDEYDANKYKEQYSFGLGRYEAIVSYIEKIKTQQEHIKLMDTVNYSYYSYRDYAQNYVGWQYTTGIETQILRV